MSQFNEQIIFDGENFEKVFLKAIENASQTIYLSTYIFANDDFGHKVWKALQKASQRKVRVRVLLDGFGSKDFIKNCSNEISNFELRVFHPLPWPFTKFKWKQFLLRWFDLYFNINRRNHQKLLIVDETLAFVGSRNIWQESLTWRETSVLLRSHEVKELVEIFAFVWRSTTSLGRGRNLYNSLRFTSSKYVLHNTTLFARFARNKKLLNRILHANDFIGLTTPYFYPPKKFLVALIDKALSGVKVQILLPKHSDVPLSKLVAQKFYPLLLNSGVQIFEYQPGILHAKSIIVDHWVLAGSSNFNQRSYRRDLEVDVALRELESIESVRSQFAKDIENSIPIRSFDSSILSFKNRIIVTALMLFKSWF